MYKTLETADFIPGPRKIFSPGGAVRAPLTRLQGHDVAGESGRL